MPEQEGYNALAFGGGSQRSVYQAFVQDKIDLLDDKLHFQPGVVVSSTYTSIVPGLNFSGQDYKLQNFNVIAEPYLGVSYDLPYHLTAYASTGKGGYFAPSSTYYPQLNENLPQPLIGLNAPRPEIIHLYEAGLRYDTGRVLLDADYFYQKVNDADSFFAYYGNGAVQYDSGNFGVQQFRGEELQAQFKATPSLDFFLNGSYNQANYLTSYFANDTPFEDQYGYVFKGDPLAAVPNWLANFGLDFNKDNFGIRVDEAYTGPEPITYDFPPILPSSLPNTTVDPNCAQNSCLGLATVPDSPNKLKELLGGPIPSIKQPGYLISNLLLTYDLPVHFHSISKLHFELNIQNLLGVNYYSHIYSSYAEFLDPNTASGYAPTTPYTSAFEGPPRSFTFQVSAKF
jgi:iron complex outermembrane receptor protein